MKDTAKRWTVVDLVNTLPPAVKYLLRSETYSPAALLAGGDLPRSKGELIRETLAKNRFAHGILIKAPVLLAQYVDGDPDKAFLHQSLTYNDLEPKDYVHSVRFRRMTSVGNEGRFHVIVDFQIGDGRNPTSYDNAFSYAMDWKEELPVVDRPEALAAVFTDLFVSGSEVNQRDDLILRRGTKGMPRKSGEVCTFAEFQEVIADALHSVANISIELRTGGSTFIDIIVDDRLEERFTKTHTQPTVVQA